VPSNYEPYLRLPICNLKPIDDQGGQVATDCVCDDYTPPKYMQDVPSLKYVKETQSVATCAYYVKDILKNSDCVYDLTHPVTDDGYFNMCDGNNDGCPKYVRRSFG
jgi:hypothetical protein